MRQLTLRGFDPELDRKIRDLARKESISLNQAVLRLLRKGAGVSRDSQEMEVVGSSLDHLFGTWTDEEHDAFMAAVSVFDDIDESMWP